MKVYSFNPEMTYRLLIVLKKSKVPEVIAGETAGWNWSFITEFSKSQNVS